MPKRQNDSVWFHIFDVVLNIIIILAVVAVIRTFLVSPFQVEGSSMVDTLQHKEYIIINKLSYFIGDPVRGDTVVFRPPNDEGKHYVKRVIGVPGDEVIVRDGKVFVRPGSEGGEVEIEEPYLNDRNAGRTYNHPPGSGDTKESKYTVPEEGYFLLGDNRQGSLDSRSFPETFVPRKNIKGKVWFVALPIRNIHVLEPVSYGF